MNFLNRMVIFIFNFLIWLLTFNTHSASATTSYPHQIGSQVLHRFKRDIPEKNISIYSSDKKWRCPDTSPTLCFYMSYDHSCHSHSDCPGNRLCCLFACSYDCARPVPVPEVIVEDFEYDATDESYEYFREQSRTTIPQHIVDKSRTTPRLTVPTDRVIQTAQVNSSGLATMKLERIETNVDNTYRKYDDLGSKGVIVFRKEVPGEFHGVIQMKSKEKASNRPVLLMHRHETFDDFRGVIQLKSKEQLDTNVNLMHRQESLEDFHQIIQLNRKDQSMIPIKYRQENLEDFHNTNSNENSPNAKIPGIHRQGTLGDIHGIIQLYPKEKLITKSNIPLIYRQEAFDDFHGVIQLNPKVVLSDTKVPALYRQGALADAHGAVNKYSKPKEKLSAIKTHELFRQERLGNFKGIIQLNPKKQLSKEQNPVLNRQDNSRDHHHLKHLKPKAKLKEGKFSNAAEMLLNLTKTTKLLNGKSDFKDIFHRKPNSKEDFKGIHQLKPKSSLSAKSVKIYKQAKNVDLQYPKKNRKNSSFAKKYKINKSISNINAPQKFLKKLKDNFKIKEQERKPTPSHSNYIEGFYKAVDDRLNAINTSKAFNQLYNDKMLFKNIKNTEENNDGFNMIDYDSKFGSKTRNISQKRDKLSTFGYSPVLIAESIKNKGFAEHSGLSSTRSFGNRAFGNINLYIVNKDNSTSNALSLSHNIKKWKKILIRSTITDDINANVVNINEIYPKYMEQEKSSTDESKNPFRLPKLEAKKPYSMYSYNILPLNQENITQKSNSFEEDYVIQPMGSSVSNLSDSMKDNEGFSSKLMPNKSAIGSFDYDTSYDASQQGDRVRLGASWIDVNVDEEKAFNHSVFVKNDNTTGNFKKSLQKWKDALKEVLEKEENLMYEDHFKTFSEKENFNVIRDTEKQTTDVVETVLDEENMISHIHSVQVTKNFETPLKKWNDVFKEILSEEENQMHEKVSETLIENEKPSYEDSDAEKENDKIMSDKNWNDIEQTILNEEEENKYSSSEKYISNRNFEKSLKNRTDLFQGIIGTEGIIRAKDSLNTFNNTKLDYIDNYKNEKTYGKDMVNKQWKDIIQAIVGKETPNNNIHFEKADEARNFEIPFMRWSDVFQKIKNSEEKLIQKSKPTLFVTNVNADNSDNYDVQSNDRKVERTENWNNVLQTIFEDEISRNNSFSDNEEQRDLKFWKGVIQDIIQKQKDEIKTGALTAHSTEDENHYRKSRVQRPEKVDYLPSNEQENQSYLDYSGNWKHMIKEIIAEKIKQNNFSSNKSVPKYTSPNSLRPEFKYKNIYDGLTLNENSRKYAKLYANYPETNENYLFPKSITNGYIEKLLKEESDLKNKKNIESTNTTVRTSNLEDIHIKTLSSEEEKIDRNGIMESIPDSPLKNWNSIEKNLFKKENNEYHEFEEDSDNEIDNTKETILESVPEVSSEIRKKEQHYDSSHSLENTHIKTKSSEEEQFDGRVIMESIPDSPLKSWKSIEESLFKKENNEFHEFEVDSDNEIDNTKETILESVPEVSSEIRKKEQHYDSSQSHENTHIKAKSSEEEQFDRRVIMESIPDSPLKNWNSIEENLFKKEDNEYREFEEDSGNEIDNRKETILESVPEVSSEIRKKEQHYDSSHSLENTHIKTKSSEEEQFDGHVIMESIPDSPLKSWKSIEESLFEKENNEYHEFEVDSDNEIDTTKETILESVPQVSSEIRKKEQHYESSQSHENTHIKAKSSEEEQFDRRVIRESIPDSPLENWNSIEENLFKKENNEYHEFEEDSGNEIDNRKEMNPESVPEVRSRIHKKEQHNIISHSSNARIYGNFVKDSEDYAVKKLFQNDKKEANKYNVLDEDIDSSQESEINLGDIQEYGAEIITEKSPKVNDKTNRLHLKLKSYDYHVESLDDYDVEKLHENKIKQAEGYHGFATDTNAVVYQNSIQGLKTSRKRKEEYNGFGKDIIVHQSNNHSHSSKIHTKKHTKYKVKLQDLKPKNRDYHDKSLDDYTVEKLLKNERNRKKVHKDIQGLTSKIQKKTRTKVTEKIGLRNKKHGNSDQLVNSLDDYAVEKLLEKERKRDVEYSDFGKSSTTIINQGDFQGFRSKINTMKLAKVIGKIKLRNLKPKNRNFVDKSLDDYAVEKLLEKERKREKVEHNDFGRDPMTIIHQSGIHTLKSKIHTKKPSKVKVGLRTLKPKSRDYYVESLDDYAVEKLLEKERKRDEEYIAFGKDPTTIINQGDIKGLRSKKRAKVIDKISLRNLKLKNRNFFDRSLDDYAVEKLLEKERKREEGHNDFGRDSKTIVRQGGIQRLNSKVHTNKSSKVKIDLRALNAKSRNYHVKSLDDYAVEKLMEKERKREEEYNDFDRGPTTITYQGDNRGISSNIYKKKQVKFNNKIKLLNLKLKSRGYSLKSIDDYAVNKLLENENKRNEHKSFDKGTTTIVYHDSIQGSEPNFHKKKLSKVNDTLSQRNFKRKNNHTKILDDYSIHKLLVNKRKQAKKYQGFATGTTAIVHQASIQGLYSTFHIKKQAKKHNLKPKNIDYHVKSLGDYAVEKKLKSARKRKEEYNGFGKDIIVQSNNHSHSSKIHTKKHTKSKVELQGLKPKNSDYHDKSLDDYAVEKLLGNELKREEEYIYFEKNTTTIINQGDIKSLRSNRSKINPKKRAKVIDKISLHNLKPYNRDFFDKSLDDYAVERLLEKEKERGEEQNDFFKDPMPIVHQRGIQTLDSNVQTKKPSKVKIGLRALKPKSRDYHVESLNKYAVEKLLGNELKGDEEYIAFGKNTTTITNQGDIKGLRSNWDFFSKSLDDYAVEKLLEKERNRGEEHNEFDKDQTTIMYQDDIQGFSSNIYKKKQIKLTDQNNLRNLKLKSRGYPVKSLDDFAVNKSLANEKERDEYQSFGKDTTVIVSQGSGTKIRRKKLSKVKDMSSQRNSKQKSNRANIAHNYAIEMLLENERKMEENYYVLKEDSTTVHYNGSDNKHVNLQNVNEELKLIFKKMLDTSRFQEKELKVLNKFLNKNLSADEKRTEEYNNWLNLIQKLENIESEKSFSVPTKVDYFKQKYKLLFKKQKNGMKVILYKYMKDTSNPVEILHENTGYVTSISKTTSNLSNNSKLSVWTPKGNVGSFKDWNAVIQKIMHKETKQKSSKLKRYPQNQKFKIPLKKGNDIISEIKTFEENTMAKLNNSKNPDILSSGEEELKGSFQTSVNQITASGTKSLRDWNDMLQNILNEEIYSKHPVSANQKLNSNFEVQLKNRGDGFQEILRKQEKIYQIKPSISPSLSTERTVPDQKSKFKTHLLKIFNFTVSGNIHLDKIPLFAKRYFDIQPEIYENTQMIVGDTETQNMSSNFKKIHRSFVKHHSSKKKMKESKDGKSLKSRNSPRTHDGIKIRVYNSMENKLKMKETKKIPKHSFEGQIFYPNLKVKSIEGMYLDAFNKSKYKAFSKDIMLESEQYKEDRYIHENKDIRNYGTITLTTPIELNINNKRRLASVHATELLKQLLLEEKNNQSSTNKNGDYSNNRNLLKLLLKFELTHQNLPQVRTQDNDPFKRINMRNNTPNLLVKLLMEEKELIKQQRIEPPARISLKRPAQIRIYDQDLNKNIMRNSQSKDNDVLNELSVKEEKQARPQGVEWSKNLFKKDPINIKIYDKFEKVTPKANQQLTNRNVLLRLLNEEKEQVKKHGIEQHQFLSHRRPIQEVTYDLFNKATTSRFAQRKSPNWLLRLLMKDEQRLQSERSASIFTKRPIQDSTNEHDFSQKLFTNMDSRRKSLDFLHKLLKQEEQDLNSRKEIESHLVSRQKEIQHNGKSTKLDEMFATRKNNHSPNYVEIKERKISSSRMAKNSKILFRLMNEEGKRGDPNEQFEKETSFLNKLLAKKRYENEEALLLKIMKSKNEIENPNDLDEIGNKANATLGSRDAEDQRRSKINRKHYTEHILHPLQKEEENQMKLITEFKGVEESNLDNEMSIPTQNNGFSSKTEHNRKKNDEHLLNILLKDKNNDKLIVDDYQNRSSRSKLFTSLFEQKRKFLINETKTEENDYARSTIYISSSEYSHTHTKFPIFNNASTTTTKPKLKPSQKSDFEFNRTHSKKTKFYQNLIPNLLEEYKIVKDTKPTEERKATKFPTIDNKLTTPTKLVQKHSKKPESDSNGISSKKNKMYTYLITTPLKKSKIIQSIKPIEKRKPIKFHNINNTPTTTRKSKKKHSQRSVSDFKRIPSKKNKIYKDLIATSMEENKIIQGTKLVSEGKAIKFTTIDNKLTTTTKFKQKHSQKPASDSNGISSKKNKIYKYWITTPLEKIKVIQGTKPIEKRKATKFHNINNKSTTTTKSKKKHSQKSVSDLNGISSMENKIYEYLITTPLEKSKIIQGTKPLEKRKATKFHNIINKSITATKSKKKHSQKSLSDMKRISSKKNKIYKDLIATPLEKFKIIQGTKPIENRKATKFHNINNTPITTRKSKKKHSQKSVYDLNGISSMENKIYEYLITTPLEKSKTIQGTKPIKKRKATKFYNINNKPTTTTKSKKKHSHKSLSDLKRISSKKNKIYKYLIAKPLEENVIKQGTKHILKRKTTEFPIVDSTRITTQQQNSQKPDFELHSKKKQFYKYLIATPLEVYGTITDFKHKLERKTTNDFKIKSTKTSYTTTQSGKYFVKSKHQSRRKHTKRLKYRITTPIVENPILRGMDFQTKENMPRSISTGKRLSTKQFLKSTNMESDKDEEFKSKPTRLNSREFKYWTTIPVEEIKNKSQKISYRSGTQFEDMRRNVIILKTLKVKDLEDKSKLLDKMYSLSNKRHKKPKRFKYFITTPINDIDQILKGRKYYPKTYADKLKTNVDFKIKNDIKDTHRDKKDLKNKLIHATNSVEYSQIQNTSTAKTVADTNFEMFSSTKTFEDSTEEYILDMKPETQTELSVFKLMSTSQQFEDSAQGYLASINNDTAIEHGKRDIIIATNNFEDSIKEYNSITRSDKVKANANLKQIPVINSFENFTNKYSLNTDSLAATENNNIIMLNKRKDTRYSGQEYTRAKSENLEKHIAFNLLNTTRKLKDFTKVYSTNIISDRVLPDILYMTTISLKQEKKNEIFRNINAMQSEKESNFLETKKTPGTNSNFTSETSEVTDKNLSEKDRYNVHWNIHKPSIPVSIHSKPSQIKPLNTTRMFGDSDENFHDATYKPKINIEEENEIFAIEDINTKYKEDFHIHDTRKSPQVNVLGIAGLKSSSVRYSQETPNILNILKNMTSSGTHSQVSNPLEFSKTQNQKTEDEIPHYARKKAKHNVSNSSPFLKTLTTTSVYSNLNHSLVDSNTSSDTYTDYDLRNKDIKLKALYTVGVEPVIQEDRFTSKVHTSNNILANPNEVETWKKSNQALENVAYDLNLKMMSTQKSEVQHEQDNYTSIPNIEVSLKRKLLTNDQTRGPLNEMRTKLMKRNSNVKKDLSYFKSSTTASIRTDIDNFFIVSLYTPQPSWVKAGHNKHAKPKLEKETAFVAVLKNFTYIDDTRSLNLLLVESNSNDTFPINVTENHNDVTDDHSTVAENHSNVTENHNNVIENYSNVTENHNNASENHNNATENHSNVTKNHSIVTENHSNVTKKHNRHIIPSEDELYRSDTNNVNEEELNFRNAVNDDKNNHIKETSTYSTDTSVDSPSRLQHTYFKLSNTSNEIPEANEYSYESEHQDMEHGSEEQTSRYKIFNKTNVSETNFQDDGHKTVSSAHRKTITDDSIYELVTGADTLLDSTQRNIMSINSDIAREYTDFKMLTKPNVLISSTNKYKSIASNVNATQLTNPVLIDNSNNFVHFTQERSLSVKRETPIELTSFKLKTTLENITNFSEEKNLSTNSNAARKHIPFSIINMKNIYKDSKKEYTSSISNDTATDITNSKLSDPTNAFDNSAQEHSTRVESESSIQQNIVEQTIKLENFENSIQDNKIESETTRKRSSFSMTNTRKIYKDSTIEYVSSTSNDTAKEFTDFNLSNTTIAFNDSPHAHSTVAESETLIEHTNFRPISRVDTSAQRNGRNINRDTTTDRATSKRHTSTKVFGGSTKEYRPNISSDNSTQLSNSSSESIDFDDSQERIKSRKSEIPIQQIDFKLMTRTQTFKDSTQWNNTSANDRLSKDSSSYDIINTAKVFSDTTKEYISSTKKDIIMEVTNPKFINITATFDYSRQKYSTTAKRDYPIELFTRSNTLEDSLLDYRKIIKSGIAVKNVNLKGIATTKAFENFVKGYMSSTSSNKAKAVTNSKPINATRTFKDTTQERYISGKSVTPIQQNNYKLLNSTDFRRMTTSKLLTDFTKINSVNINDETGTIHKTFNATKDFENFDEVHQNVKKLPNMTEQSLNIDFRNIDDVQDDKENNLLDAGEISQTYAPTIRRNKQFHPSIRPQFHPSIAARIFGGVEKFDKDIKYIKNINFEKEKENVAPKNKNNMQSHEENIYYMKVTAVPILKDVLQKFKKVNYTQVYSHVSNILDINRRPKLIKQDASYQRNVFQRKPRDYLKGTSNYPALRDVKKFRKVKYILKDSKWMNFRTLSRIRPSRIIFSKVEPTIPTSIDIKPFAHMKNNDLDSKIHSSAAPNDDFQSPKIIIENGREGVDFKNRKAIHIQKENILLHEARETPPSNFLNLPQLRTLSIKYFTATPIPPVLKNARRKFQKVEKNNTRSQLQNFLHFKAISNLHKAVTYLPIRTTESGRKNVVLKDTNIIHKQIKNLLLQKTKQIPHAINLKVPRMAPAIINNLKALPTPRIFKNSSLKVPHLKNFAIKYWQIPGTQYNFGITPKYVNKKHLQIINAEKGKENSLLKKINPDHSQKEDIHLHNSKDLPYAHVIRVPQMRHSTISYSKALTNLPVLRDFISRILKIKSNETSIKTETSNERKNFKIINTTMSIEGKTQKRSGFTVDDLTKEHARFQHYFLTRIKLLSSKSKSTSTKHKSTSTKHKSTKTKYKSTSTKHKSATTRTMPDTTETMSVTSIIKSSATKTKSPTKGYRPRIKLESLIEHTEFELTNTTEIIEDSAQKSIASRINNKSIETMNFELKNAPNLLGDSVSGHNTKETDETSINNNFKPTKFELTNTTEIIEGSAQKSIASRINNKSIETMNFELKNAPNLLGDSVSGHNTKETYETSINNNFKPTEFELTNTTEIIEGSAQKSIASRINNKSIETMNFELKNAPNLLGDSVSGHNTKETYETSINNNFKPTEFELTNTTEIIEDSAQKLIASRINNKLIETMNFELKNAPNPPEDSVSGHNTKETYETSINTNFKPTKFELTNTTEIIEDSAQKLIASRNNDKSIETMNFELKNAPNLLEDSVSGHNTKETDETSINTNFKPTKFELTNTTEIIEDSAQKLITSRNNDKSIETMNFELKNAPNLLEDSVSGHNTKETDETPINTNFKFKPAENWTRSTNKSIGITRNHTSFKLLNTENVYDYFKEWRNARAVSNSSKLFDAIIASKKFNILKDFKSTAELETLVGSKKRNILDVEELIRLLQNYENKFLVSRNMSKSDSISRSENIDQIQTFASISVTPLTNSAIKFKPTKPIDFRLQNRIRSDSKPEFESFSKSEPPTAVNSEVHRYSKYTLSTSGSSFQHQATVSWQNFKSTTDISEKKVLLEDVVPRAGIGIHEDLHPALFEYLYPPVMGAFKDESYFMEDLRHRSARHVGGEDTPIKPKDTSKLSVIPPKPPEENIHDQIYRNKLVLTIR